MDLQQIIEELSNEQLTEFPEQALLQARILWPELLPHIDGLMEKFIQQQALTDSENSLLLFGIFLLADRAEASRFEVLTQLCNNSDEGGEPLDCLLNDAICEDLPTILFILANGRSQGLIELLLSDRSGEFVKSAALSAFVAQIEAGQWRAEQFDAIFPELMAAGSDSLFLMSELFIYALLLDRRSLQPLMLDYFAQVDIDELEQDLDLDAIKNWQLPYGFALPKAGGFVAEQLDVMAMRNWAWFSAAAQPSLWDDSVFPLPTHRVDDLQDYIRSHTPYVAPAKVGRNDPCPCGSGKKFKKCCLQCH